MKAIQVAFPAESDLTRTYRSVSEAIEAGLQLPRQPQARYDTARARGGVMTGYCMGRTSLEIVLSGTGLLRFWVDRGEVVEWDLSEREVDDALPQQAEVGCLGNAVLLKYPSEGEEAWERKALLDARLGCEFQMIWAGSHWVYLYMQDRETLLLMALIDHDTGMPFLYWSETP